LYDMRRKRPRTDPRAPHKRSAPFAGHTLAIPLRCSRSCPDHWRDRGPPFPSPHDGRPPDTNLPGCCTVLAPVLGFDWITQLCIGLSWVRRWPRSSVAPRAALEPPTRQLPRRVHWRHPRHAPAALLSSCTFRGSCWSPHVRKQLSSRRQSTAPLGTTCERRHRVSLSRYTVLLHARPAPPPLFFVRSRGLPPVYRGLVLCLPHPRSVPTWSPNRCAAPPRSGSASSRNPLHTFVSFCVLPPPFCVLAVPLFPPFRGCPVGQHVAPRRLPHAHSSPFTCL